MNKILLLLSLSLSACLVEPPPPTQKELQAAKAEQAAQQIDFDENAEIENIKRRLELTSAPGLLGYIILFNDMGQPIKYTTVKGKVTSGSKRLTSPDTVRTYGVPGGYASHIVDAPSDEGTYGSSNPYIYFWDQNGTYIQWSGDYLYSDKPFRLTVEPLVVEVQ